MNPKNPDSFFKLPPLILHSTPPHKWSHCPEASLKSLALCRWLERKTCLMFKLILFLDPVNYIFLFRHTHIFLAPSRVLLSPWQQPFAREQPVPSHQPFSSGFFAPCGWTLSQKKSCIRAAGWDGPSAPRVRCAPLCSSAVVLYTFRTNAAINASPLHVARDPPTSFFAPFFLDIIF